MRSIKLGRALLGAGILLGAAPVGFATDADDNGLQEIVVTAQRFSATVQNTPISISAITGDQLDAAGITSIEELSHDVPGLSMRSAGPGQTEYEARGLASSGGSSPTVGFYLDDIPLTPPSTSQTGKVVIDPNLYDIDRIELLRGPQGTLYGSGSMGGTVRVITNQPKLSSFDGSFEGVVSNTEGGNGNGSGNLMLNIPAGDMWALRLVGTDTWRSGWIDRVVLNPFPADSPLSGPPPYRRGDVLAAPVQSVDRNVNTENLYGGRATLLFQPNSDFSAVATALYQRMVMGGYDTFDSPPGAAELAHYEAGYVAEPIADTVHIYSLTLKANLGFADLTSASAYWDRQEHQTQDASESVSSILGIYPYTPLPWSEIDTTRQSSEELRLTSHEDGRLRWVAGGFYSDLNSLWQLYSASPFFASPGNTPGVVGAAYYPYRMEQYALFVDGSYKLTDTLTFSTGLRWYRYLSRSSQQQWGLLTASLTPSTPSETQASDRGYNPRFNLSYAPTQDLTTYISASKGFRPGGANQVIPPPSISPFCQTGAPSTFGPDSVWDYEIGEKTRGFDGRLSVNSDFYYIKWNGVQETLLLTCGYQYIANAGNGRSFGPELEINAKLSNAWSVIVSASYTDAKVTSPSPQFIGNVLGSVASCQTASHCTLPILNVPKDAASLAILYTTPVFNGYQLTARLDDTYVGSSYDASFYFGIPLPSYNIASARVGLAGDKWSVHLFVDNLTNKVAEITANNTSFQVNIPGLVRYC